MNCNDVADDEDTAFARRPRDEIVELLFVHRFHDLPFSVLHVMVLPRGTHTGPGAAAVRVPAYRGISRAAPPHTAARPPV